jgi:uncharacterized protein involved in outer membrane biogenesis
MLRLLKWTLGVFVLLAVLVLVVIPLVVNTEAGRKRVAASLSRALRRDVRIGDLSVGLLFSSVRVDGLRVENPPDYPPGPMIEAGLLKFDVGWRALLEGRLEGTATGKGLRVRVQKRGEGTNLDGLGGEPRAETKPEGDRGPDLHVGVELEDCDVAVEDLDRGETLALNQVSARFVLSNREGQRDASLGIRVGAIDGRALRVRDLDVQAVQAGDLLDLRSLRARLGDGGTIEGKGTLRVRGAAPGEQWNLELQAKGVRIDQQVLPIVRTIFPLAAAAEGQLRGSLEGRFALAGSGLTWETAKSTLKGGGDVRLVGMGLPETSVLVQIAAMTGRAKGAVELNDAGATFVARDGWVEFSRLSASGEQVRYDLSGRVSLDGRLELEMDVLPLVQRYGGGELAKYKDKVRRLPLRIGGTTVRPKLELPLEEIAKHALTRAVLDELTKKLGR